MNRDRIINLYQRYLNGNLDLQETVEWEEMLLDPLSQADLEGVINETWRNLREAEQLSLNENRSTEILYQIIGRPVIRHRRLWMRWAVAAAIVIIIFGVGLFYISNKNNMPVTTVNISHDLAPGKHTATLTLADGKRIVLSDALNGKLASEAGVLITKTKDGQLIYQVQSTESGMEQGGTNTLTTARGEMYEVRLPDGSSVFLNAASKLTYPANFAKNSQRRVELDGEAYFMVAKDKTHPFIVKTDKQEVEVLGTHFNINSYADAGNIRTTLLEGSVKVTALNSGNTRILKPGEQAVQRADQLAVSRVDPEDVVAWKEGLFVFDGQQLEQVMNELSRWYSVEIEYKDPSVKALEFSGSVSKFSNASEVLKKLEQVEAVKFTIVGNKIIVEKK